jgi:hypothetical protein
MSVDKIAQILKKIFIFRGQMYRDRRLGLLRSLWSNEADRIININVITFLKGMLSF